MQPAFGPHPMSADSTLRLRIFTDQRARDMTQTGKKLFVRTIRTGAIDIAHRLAIVPATEMRQYLDARLPLRRQAATESYSLVVLERDLSEDGREYISTELLQAPTEAALIQAMREGLLLRDTPLLRAAAKRGLLQLAASGKQDSPQTDPAGAGQLA